MTKKNAEYDFEWCPGCGDFGVRRALEMAVQTRMVEAELPIENNVVIAGIGCSGNMVHLMEGPQPFGFHGTHGRTLPMAMGIKLARPDLNVIIVAGDGDFLSIGAEHLGPQAQRNLNVTAVIMDNAVYGLTKGQTAPTTELGVVTPTTPYGKLERAMNPLDLYLTLGVTSVANSYSSRVKDLSSLIVEAMNHPGFAIVHVQSPCTTYNDTHDELRGSPRKGIQPKIWDIPQEHDSSDLQAAHRLAQAEGVPLGLLYRDPNSISLDQRIEQQNEKVTPRSVEQLMASYKV